MFIGVVGAAFVPLLFIFVTPSTMLWLIPVQILSGVAWAGVGLINFSMFLDTTDDEKRVFQTADYNIITTLPMIFAPIIGGYIAENWTLAMAGIPLLFLISTILRLSALPLLSRIKEPHVKKEYDTSFVLRQFVTVHPARGLAHEIRTANKEIKHLVRKL
jgi:MFS family permease